MIRLRTSSCCTILTETAKILALLSSKSDKYEYLTDEEILPPNQNQITEQAKFTFSPLRKAFEKQKKRLEIKGKKLKL